MNSDTAVIERLQQLASAAGSTVSAPPSLAADVLRQQRRTRRRRARGSIAGSVTGLVAIGAVVGATQLGHRSYVVQYEPSRAMAPTVQERESVLVGRSLQAERGDVVSYRMPVEGNAMSISRVVAIGGDTISCPAGSDGLCTGLVVNGAAADESYLAPSRQRAFTEQTVPKGQVFMVGDNREEAYDSRMFGPITASRITGVAVRILTADGSRRVIPGSPSHPAPGDTDINDPDPLPTAAAAVTPAR